MRNFWLSYHCTLRLLVLMFFYSLFFLPSSGSVKLTTLPWSFKTCHRFDAMHQYAVSNAYVRYTSWICCRSAEIQHRPDVRVCAAQVFVQEAIWCRSCMLHAPSAFPGIWYQVPCTSYTTDTQCKVYIASSAVPETRTLG